MTVYGLSSVLRAPRQVPPPAVLRPLRSLLHGFDVDAWLVSVVEPRLEGEHVAFAVPELPSGAAHNPRVARALRAAGIEPTAGLDQAVAAQLSFSVRVAEAAAQAWREPVRAALPVPEGMGRALDHEGCYRLTARRSWGLGVRRALGQARPSLGCRRLSEILSDDGLTGALLHYLSVLAVSPLYLPRTRGSRVFDPAQVGFERVLLAGAGEGVLAFTGRDTMGHYTAEADLAYDVAEGRQVANWMRTEAPEASLLLDPGSAYGLGVPGTVVRMLRTTPSRFLAALDDAER